MSIKEARKQLLLPYEAPEFYTATEPAHGKDRSITVPQHRVRLANLPTPIEPFYLPEMPEDTALLIKRDDMTAGVEMCGNKIRKLEFLMADAIAQGADAVLTAGGTQSNHARATAAACCKMRGMPIHLLLRKDSIGTNGNFFLNTMFGANVVERPLDEWINMKKARPDSWLQHHAEEVGAKIGGGAQVYPIPVGGSNPLGCWGYLEAVNEIVTQFKTDEVLTARGGFGEVSDVSVCTGSGGTLTGLSLGLHKYAAFNGLSSPIISAYGVCDDAQYFYDTCGSLLKHVTGEELRAADLFTARCAKGLGYAKSTTEELQFVSRVSRETGIIFDPCYTGKAVMKLWNELKSGELKPKKQLLFIHTGGAPSVFDKTDVLPDA